LCFLAPPPPRTQDIAFVVVAATCALPLPFPSLYHSLVWLTSYLSINLSLTCTVLDKTYYCSHRPCHSPSHVVIQKGRGQERENTSFPPFRYLLPFITSSLSRFHCNPPPDTGLPVCTAQVHKRVYDWFNVSLSQHYHTQTTALPPLAARKLVLCCCLSFFGFIFRSSSLPHETRMCH